MNPHTELTDEEIQRQLAGESVRGPRTFRGQPLAPYSLNARALTVKVLGIDAILEVAYVASVIQSQPEIAAAAELKLVEHDFVVLQILADAFCEGTAEAKALTRRNLLFATDDAFGYRTKVSEIIDTASDADRQQARRLVNDILAAIESSEVELASSEKKSAAQEVTEPSPTLTPSPSGKSRAKRAGRRTSSAGKSPS